MEEKISQETEEQNSCKSYNNKVFEGSDHADSECNDVDKSLPSSDFPANCTEVTASGDVVSEAFEGDNEMSDEKDKETVTINSKSETVININEISNEIELTIHNTEESKEETCTMGEQSNDEHLVGNNTNDDSQDDPTEIQQFFLSIMSMLNELNENDENEEDQQTSQFNGTLNNVEHANQGGPSDDIRNNEPEEEFSDEIRKIASAAEEKYLLWLPDDDEDIHDCTICFATSEINNIIYCEECDEHVCFSCLKRHVEVSIALSKIVIECPGSTDCTKKLSDQIISAFASMKSMKILVKNRVEVEQNPNIKTCPGCHKVEIQTNEKLKGIPMKCTSCNLSWCFSCHAPWHSGITCADYQKDIEGAGKKALKYWAKITVNGSNNAKKCPKCQHYIERITGCDHMVCSKCKTDFCYRCGGKHYSFGWLGDHHSTYSFLGCKYNLHPHRPLLRIGIRMFVAFGVVAIFPFMVLLLIIFGVIVLPCMLIRRKCKR